MKNFSLKSLLILCVFYSNAAQATDITDTQTATVNVNSNNQIINISGAGNLLVDGMVGIANSTYSGAVININTTLENNGISAGNSAIAISGNGSLSALNLTSGTITSASSSGSVYLTGLGGVTNINVGQDSGNSATISNTADDFHTIISDTTNNTDLTFNNKATGAISTTTSQFTYANAISLSDSDSGSKLTLSNAGTITATYSAIEVSGYSGSVTNSGTINGSIVQHGAEDFVITNLGTINGDVTLGGSTSLILSGGTITGQVLMSSTLGTSVTFNGGNLIGDIIYDGSVFVNANTTNHGGIGYSDGGGEARISSFAIAEGKSLNTTNGSLYTSNISLATGSTLNTGSGVINASGNFIAGSNVNITAATFTNAGSVLALTVMPSTTSVTLNGNAVLSATTLNLTMPNTVAAGDVITLIDASSITGITTISNENININGSDSNQYGLNTFSASLVGNKLILTATAVAAPTLSNGSDQSTFNAIAAASTNGNLAAMQNYLGDSANSNAQKEEAIKSTSAQVDNSANRVAFDNIAATSGIISARLESLRSNEVGNISAQNQPIQLADNSAFPLFAPLKSDDDSSKSAIWIQAFGSKISQGNTRGSDGYSANSGGVIIGIDKKLTSNFILGVNSGFSKTKIDGRNSYKTTDIDTYQLGVYSGFDAQSYFLNTSLGLAVNEYSSNRYIAVAGVSAKADYTGIGYNARAELGKNFHFQNEILFTPTLAVTAATNKINSYSESDAGTLNLNVKSGSANFFEARAGAELSQLLTIQNTQMRPIISASYGYDFAGSKQKSTANFIGQNTAFATTAARVAQGSLRLGTGVSFYTKNDVTLSLNYTFEQRRDFIANSGWLRAGYRF